MNKCLTCKHRRIHKSVAGYYIGTYLDNKPYCRISGYFESKQQATQALKSGEFMYYDSIKNYLVRTEVLSCGVNK